MLPKFQYITRRPETLEQKIDRSLAKPRRPLKHLTMEELRLIVDELEEEVRLICPKRRTR